MTRIMVLYFTINELSERIKEYNVTYCEMDTNPSLTNTSNVAFIAGKVKQNFTTRWHQNIRISIKFLTF